MRCHLSSLYLECRLSFRFWCHIANDMLTIRHTLQIHVHGGSKTRGFLCDRSSLGVHVSHGGLWCKAVVEENKI